LRNRIFDKKKKKKEKEMEESHYTIINMRGGAGFFQNGRYSVAGQR
jgi:hypothetical protein